MAPQQGFVQPLLPRPMPVRPAALCPTPSRPPSFKQRRPARATTRATTRASAADSVNGVEAPVADDEEDAMHDSWKVYSKPGNLCVVCNGRGESKCLYCFGEGTVRVGPEDGRDTIVCPLCDSRGTETCLRCHGSGIRPATRIDLKTGEIVRNLTNEEVCQLATEAELEAIEASRKAKAEEDAEAEAKQTASESTESGDVEAAVQ